MTAPTLPPARPRTLMMTTFNRKRKHQQIQQIQPEEMCVAQEGGAEMEMTEVRASECVWRSAWIEAGRLLPLCMPHISIFCSHHSAKQRRVSIPCVPNPLYPVPDVMAVEFRRK